MSSTYSPNKIYELQATGENTGTWGTLLNAVLSIIDLNFGGRLALNVAGSSDITLTATQERNAYMLMTGILTGSINLIFTASNGGFYLLDNRSTGSFTITAKPSGGTGVVIPQGAKCLVMVDPDNTRCVIIDLAQMMTTRGDILYRDANGVQRLAVGAAARVLRSNGTDPAWAQVALATDVSGTLPVANGGTASTTALGAIVAIGGGAASAVSANKGGSDQAVATTAVTTVTLGTETYDVGNNFASNTWTPPAGKVQVRGHVTFSNVSEGNTLLLMIYQDGVEVARTTGFLGNGGGSSDFTLEICREFAASGTNAYTLVVQSPGDSSYTILGAATKTWFNGHIF